MKLVIDMDWLCAIVISLIGLVPDEIENKTLHPPPLGSDSQSGRTNLWRADAFGFAMKEIPLTNSPLKALISNGDYALLSQYSWHLDANGYVVHSLTSRTKIRMHRIVMKAKTGQIVDHKNHDLLDNRRFRLRIATRKENNRNQIISLDRKEGASSVYKGVYWHKREGKWRAQIGVNYNRVMLGTFPSELAAARAYNRAARRYYGRFAYPNPV